MSHFDTLATKLSRSTEAVALARAEHAELIFSRLRSDNSADRWAQAIEAAAWTRTKRSV